MKIGNMDFSIPHVSGMTEQEFRQAFRGQFNGDLRSAWKQLQPHLVKKDKALQTEDKKTKPEPVEKTKVK